MTAEAKFFERDYTHESVMRDRTVVKKEYKNALWFKMSKPSIAGAPAIPYEIECLAEESHIKGYPAAYEEYLNSKPQPMSVKVMSVKMIEEVPVIEESLGAEI